MTVVSVNSAGPDQTVTRGKLQWCGRTSTPWPPRSSRSSSTPWSWLRPPPTQTMWLPPSTGWDCWDQMGLSPRSPTSQSTTSSSGSTTILSATLFWVIEHHHISGHKSKFVNAATQTPRLCLDFSWLFLTFDCDFNDQISWESIDISFSVWCALMACVFSLSPQVPVVHSKPLISHTKDQHSSPGTGITSSAWNESYRYV